MRIGRFPRPHVLKKKVERLADRAGKTVVAIIALGEGDERRHGSAGQARPQGRADSARRAARQVPRLASSAIRLSSSASDSSFSSCAVPSFRTRSRISASTSRRACSLAFAIISMVRLAGPPERLQRAGKNGDLLHVELLVPGDFAGQSRDEGLHHLDVGAPWPWDPSPSRTP